ncbi:MAG: hypothetical protein ACRDMX_11750 [Solirubrobacteraceae bacterium]
MSARATQPTRPATGREIDALIEAEATVGANRSAPAGLLGRLLAGLRADALTRSSSLLIVNYMIVGALGGICSIIATHGWSPHQVGAVAAITGVVALLSTGTSSGPGSTITRFLGGERNQLSFVAEASLLVVLAGLGVSAAVAFVPGHFGVRITDLFGGSVLAFALIGGCVAAKNITAVTDPAFVARKEVSYAVVKDLAAALLRIGILVALIGTGARGLFIAMLLYVAIAALMDVGLVGARLRDAVPHSALRQLRMIRRRLRFVAGSHSAALVAALPTTLLPAIVAAVDGPASAAYVGIPLTIATYLTIIPSMTSQALLTELSGSSTSVPRTAARALRLAYVATMPVAIVLIALAPEVLLVFGHSYSVHGSEFLRWLAASTVFSTFNYIGDTVLLARQRVLAYNVVNCLGTVAVLGCLAGAVAAGFEWIGPGLFLGQILYAAISLATIGRYGAPRDALAALAALRWRV